MLPNNQANATWIKELPRQALFNFLISKIPVVLKALGFGVVCYITMSFKFGIHTHTHTDTYTYTHINMQTHAHRHTHIVHAYTHLLPIVGFLDLPQHH